MSTHMQIRAGQRFAIAGMALAATALAGACRDEPPSPTAPRGLPTAPGFDVVTTAAATTKEIPANGRRLDVITDTNPPPRTRYRTEYHGNPVMAGYSTVYVIWYGNWNLSTTDSATFHIVTDFLSTVGLTPYFSTLARYPGTSGAPSGGLYYGQSVVDAFSRGATLNDADVEEIVKTAMTSALPHDPVGIYLVLASPEVTDTTGLDVNYCGRHGWGMIWGARTRYAFVGSPLRSAIQCSPQPIGPNGTLNADAMVSHIAAELANVITDPYLNAWYDKLGLEPADKCVWTYGTIYRAPNGAAANIHLGQRDFLLQQLWLPSKNGGSCVMRP